MPPQTCKLNVRDAQREDVVAMSELACRAGFNLASADLAIRLEGLLQQAADHRLLVAVADDNAMRGWLHVFVRRSMEFDPSVELGTLVIDPDFRRAGVGHQLVGEAEKLASQMGCARLVTRLGTTNTEAKSFFEHMGFESVKEQRVFHKHVKLRIGL